MKMKKMYYEISPIRANEILDKVGPAGRSWHQVKMELEVYDLQGKLVQIVNATSAWIGLQSGTILVLYDSNGKKYYSPEKPTRPRIKIKPKKK